jgi:hypothetical protein
MKSFILVIYLVGFAQVMFAQIPVTPGDTNTYIVTKINGTEYIGKILNDDGREVLIQTETLGKIYIPKADIKSIVLLEDVKSVIRGEYYASGPFTTRHAFTTNALPIKKGENYAIINLYGPEVHFAVTNHLNVGIMSTWLASPLVFATKYTIPTRNEKLNFSVGTLFGTSGYFNNFDGYGGLHFANVTYGDRKNNITFSAGYGYASNFRGKELIKPATYYSTTGYFNYNYDRFSANMIKGPIFSIAAIAKVGAKASFIFDSMLGSFSSSSSSNNYVYTTITEATPPDYNNGLYQSTVSIDKTKSTNVYALFIMPGMRFQTKENRAFQVSLAGVALFDNGNNYSAPIPMCSWFYKF